jgi:aminopeptidase YwaD
MGEIIIFGKSTLLKLSCMKRFISFLSIVFSTLVVYSGHDTDLSVRLRDHVRILASDSLYGRGLGTEGSEMAREYIVSQFMEAGITPLFDYFLQPFKFRSGVAWIPAVNIAGYIEGSDPVLKNEFIVIGAHYDHIGYTRNEGGKTIFPGADDNASGVATIIEIGRYFVQNSSLLGRSLIILAFDAEESGLRGSRYFVENSPVPLDKIKLMFSFDMVGMYATNQGIHLRGMGSLEGGVDMAQSIAGQKNVSLKNTGSNIERRTDTAPFGDRGIPAAHVFTGTKSPYHKPGDKYHLLDYDGMSKITVYMKSLLAEFSNKRALVPDNSLLATNESDVKSKAFSYGLVLNNGSGFHRYKDEFYRANPLHVFSSGLYFQVPVSKLFTIQTEILYDFNGSRVPGGNFRRHSLTVPLNMQIGTPRQLASGVRIYIFGGAWYRYSFTNNQDNFDLGLMDLSNPNEWGYSAGVGLDIFRFMVGFTSRAGLSNINQDHSEKVMDTNRYFTLGYRF